MNTPKGKPFKIIRILSNLPLYKVSLEFVSCQRSKTAELDTLKKEFAGLQHRIDESLKAVENGETPEQPNSQMPDEINDLERA